jgi:hypothetical protein
LPAYALLVAMIRHSPSSQPVCMCMIAWARVCRLCTCGTAAESAAAAAAAAAAAEVDPSSTDQLLLSAHGTHNVFFMCCSMIIGIVTWDDETVSAPTFY